MRELSLESFTFRSLCETANRKARALLIGFRPNEYAGRHAVRVHVF